MDKKPVYLSAALHAAFFVIATMSWSFLRRDFEIPQPLTVEFADIDKITQTTKVAPQPTPKKEEKKDEPPKPTAAPTNKSSEPTPPKPKDDVKKDDKPDDKKEDVAEVPDKKAPPEKKKDKKEEKKKDEPKPSKDFSSVLKNLADPKEDADKTDKPDMKTEAAAADGQNAPLGAKMTMSEEDALRVQLEKCWNVPVGAKDVENMVVEIFMVINPDRTLREAKVVDTARYNSDTFFRAAADAALRAVHNPLCSPFQLPPDKYEVWKTTTVNFNPSQMF